LRVFETPEINVLRRAPLSPYFLHSFIYILNMKKPEIKWFTESLIYRAFFNLTEIRKNIGKYVWWSECGQI